MPRSLRSRSHLSPANKDMQAACGSKRVAASREIGLQTPADADQFPNEHAADGDGKDCNQEDEVPGTADGGELVSRPKTRARKLKEPQSQQESDHQQSKRQKIANSGSAPSRKPLTWEDSFKLLEQYKEDNNHTRVHKNYVDASTGSKLGHWVNSQRKSYAKKKLSEEREQRLDSIGFEWKPREQNESKLWDTWFQLLVTFKKEHEHTRVPHNYVDAMGPKLGIWVSKQRKSYARKKLSDERIHRLNSIGFELKARKQRDSESWDTSFQLLVKYKEKHDHTRVPQRYVDKSTGSRLGGWVHYQRQQYSEDQLSEERRQRLESIGFEWSASHRGGLKKRISLYCSIRTLREVDPRELAVVLTEGRPWRCVSGEDESGAVGVVDGTVVSVPFDDDFVWF